MGAGQRGTYRQDFVAEGSRNRTNRGDLRGDRVGDGIVFVMIS
jgi:hypothetical protein